MRKKSIEFVESIEFIVGKGKAADAKVRRRITRKRRQENRWREMIGEW